MRRLVQVMCKLCKITNSKKTEVVRMVGHHIYISIKKYDVINQSYVCGSPRQNESLLEKYADWVKACAPCLWWR